MSTKPKATALAAAALRAAVSDPDKPGQPPVDPLVRGVVRLLDDVIRIPGTKIGIGLDSILGFVLPGAGDAATGIISALLLFVALKRRLPTATLARMLLNIAIDVLVGLVPIAGDLFDVVWKSNRRNLELIQRHQGESKPSPRTADYVIVGVGLLLAVSGVVLPLVVLGLLGWGGWELVRALFGDTGGAPAG